MRKHLLLILSFFSLVFYFSNTFAQEDSNMLTVKKTMVLVNEPIETLQRCAKMGAVFYQNALSMVYLYGRNSTQKSPDQGYAWALVASYQINKTEDRPTMLGARENLKHIRQQLTVSQIARGETLALDYIRDNSKNWPKILSLTGKFSDDCPSS